MTKFMPSFAVILYFVFFIPILSYSEVGPSLHGSTQFDSIQLVIERPNRISFGSLGIDFNLSTNTDITAEPYLINDDSKQSYLNEWVVPSVGDISISPNGEFIAAAVGTPPDARFPSDFTGRKVIIQSLSSSYIHEYEIPVAFRTGIQTDPPTMVWSDDQRYLALLSDESNAITILDIQSEVVINSVNTYQNSPYFNNFAWISNDTIAYVRQNDEGNEFSFDIYITVVTTNATMRLTNERFSDPIRQLHWRSQMRHLLFVVGDIRTSNKVYVSDLNDNQVKEVILQDMTTPSTINLVYDPRWPTTYILQTSVPGESKPFSAISRLGDNGGYADVIWHANLLVLGLGIINQSKVLLHASSTETEKMLVILNEFGDPIHDLPGFGNICNFGAINDTAFVLLLREHSCANSESEQTLVQVKLESFSITTFTVEHDSDYYFVFPIRDKRFWLEAYEYWSRD
ncbi:MAG: hypothetical protein IPK52_21090 [Chloroflexi bacterium]|nr:hypothetical protein [Chloroflexota bacterium]